MRSAVWLQPGVLRHSRPWQVGAVSSKVDGVAWIHLENSAPLVGVGERLGAVQVGGSTHKGRAATTSNPAQGEARGTRTPFQGLGPPNDIISQKAFGRHV
jgi:hypothetical protein